MGDENDERDYDEVTLPENVIPFPRERIVRWKRTKREVIRAKIKDAIQILLELLDVA